MAMVVGIDEAGRGPWAGPVVAGAILLIHPEKISPTIIRSWRDSKRLSRPQREAIFSQLCKLDAEKVLAMGIGQASVAEITQFNILQATFLAMKRALFNLMTTSGQTPQGMWVDGNRLPIFTNEELIRLPDCFVSQSRAIIAGDAHEPIISAASIVAKVTRDRIMAEWDQNYPQYGFARHQGYGTKAHQAALRRLGICPAHRPSFAPIARLIRG